MSMTPTARRDAIFASIAQANPRMANLSAAETQAMKDSLLAIFGADLTYITGNAVVPGSQYQAPSTSCTVATATGPASGTTVASTVQGIGRIS